MAQPAHIELQTGADRFYHWAKFLLWTLAVAVFAAFAPDAPWQLSVAALSLIVYLWPATDDPIAEPEQLYLYRSGAAKLGDKTGSWGSHSSVCRWFSIVQIDLPQKARKVLICASRNHNDDYRQLLVWTRFPP